MKLRVAVDANVLVAGFGWPRWPYEVLRHAEKGDFTLVLAELVINEARKNIQRRLSQHLHDFELFLQDVGYELAPMPSHEELAAHADLVRQAEDIPVAISVRNAQVNYFVTYDKDFTDDHESTARVRAAIPGIILPPVFLRDVMGWTSEQLEEIRNRNWSDL